MGWKTSESIIILTVTPIQKISVDCFTNGTFPQAEGDAVEAGTAMRYVFAGTIILSSSMKFNLSNYLHQDSSGPEMVLLFLYIQDCLSRKLFPVILNEQATSIPFRMIGWTYSLWSLICAPTLYIDSLAKSQWFFRFYLNSIYKICLFGFTI